jgi:hypothetical protein
MHFFEPTRKSQLSCHRCETCRIVPGRLESQDTKFCIFTNVNIEAEAHQGQDTATCKLNWISQRSQRILVLDTTAVIRICFSGYSK